MLNKCCIKFSRSFNFATSYKVSVYSSHLHRASGFIVNRNTHSSSFTHVLSRRDAICVHRRINVCELTLAAGRTLMVSRVFTVALSFVRIIPHESTPSAGNTYQTRCSSHLPIYFQAVERPPAPSESTAQLSALRRPKSIPEEPSTMKSAWLSVSRNLPVLSENKVEIAPDEWRWCPMLHENAPRPSSRNGIINYYQTNSSRRAWLRTNKCRACGACTHGRIRLAQL